MTRGIVNAVDLVLRVSKLNTKTRKHNKKVAKRGAFVFVAEPPLCVF